VQQKAPYSMTWSAMARSRIKLQFSREAQSRISAPNIEMGLRGTRRSQQS
jgi:hypothetical protein